jgi:hypothetical protein
MVRQAIHQARVIPRDRAMKTGPARGVLRVTVMKGTRADPQEVMRQGQETRTQIAVEVPEAIVAIPPALGAEIQGTIAAAIRSATVAGLPAGTVAETRREIGEAWAIAKLLDAPCH